MIRQAVFLVGGLGTRLKDRTRDTPKPLLQIGGRPFLEYLLDEAVRHGFTDILLLAGYKAGQVVTQYDGRDWRGGRIRVLCEKEALGTGGALRQALPNLDPFFLMMNGDSFFDVNLRAIAMAENLRPDGVAMALRPGADDNRFGRVKFVDGLVRSFHAPEEGVDGPINGGVYCIGREAVAAMPERKFSLEGEVFPQLAQMGRIRGLMFDSYFIDIGVPGDFERADAEVPARVTRPAVFFDRDGVLNVDTGYVHRVEDFVWREGAKKAIRLCNDRGYLAFVVTNQAGVARNYYDEGAVGTLHGWMAEDLAKDGAHIDEFEYCPHHPDAVNEKYRRACPRRKPEPGMILDLMARWPVAAGSSLLIGDKDSDLAAAAAAGLPGRLYTGGDLEGVIREALS